MATVLFATLLGHGAVHAGAETQRELCEGYSSGTCSLVPHITVASSDQILRVRATGNPGTRVAVQFYVIEFNSQGELTGLVPSGDPAEGSTNSSGWMDEIKLVPRTVPDVPGGWGFVGLADDTSLDLATRTGQVVEFGGRTLKILGDGYAEQKPVGVPLDMHVIGNVAGVGYWVEHLGPDGDWVPVPGQGYAAAQRLLSSPGEISQLTYTVPADLVAGQPYRFRVNHHLNFGGAADRPIASPAFVEWTVIPSEQGEGRERGKQLDPTKAPGLPDAPAPSGPDSTPSQAPRPTAPPEATTVPEPTTAPEPAPSAASSAPSAPPQRPDGDLTAQPPPSPAAPSPAAPSSRPGPTETTDPDQPSPDPPGVDDETSEGEVVWGDEARAVVSARVDESPAPVRWVLAVVLLIFVATPGVWVAMRRRSAQRTGETW